MIVRLLVAPLLVSVSGCSQPPPTEMTLTPAPRASASAPAATGGLDQGTLPDKVQDLPGTPLAYVAADIDQAMQKPGPEAGGAFFLLISPTNPEKGALVWDGPKSSVPETSNKKAGQVKVTGTVKSFADSKLAEAVKTKTGVALCTSGGKLQYIVLDNDIWAAASATPEASSTPQGSATPLEVPDASSSTPEAP